MKVSHVATMTAALSLVLGASTASAQTWQAITNTNATGNPFWNNPSDDQAGAGACNIGSLLTNAGLTPMSCNSEIPAALLPLANRISPNPNQFLGNGANPAAFAFGAGTYNLTLFGTITGSAPVRAWGAYDRVTDAFLGTVMVAGNSNTIVAANGFYLRISAFSPAGTLFRSDVLTAGRSQFAAFSFTGAEPAFAGGLFSGTSFGNPVYVGLEDNACVTLVGCTLPDGSTFTPNVSDQDFNDVIISVTAVPEPSTVILMAFGMAGLGLVARRRRA